MTGKNYSIAVPFGIVPFPPANVAHIPLICNPPKRPNILDKQ